MPGRPRWAPLREGRQRAADRAGPAPARAGSPDGVLRAVAEGEAPARAVLGHARPGAGTREMVRELGRLDALSGGVGPDLAPLVADPAVSDVLVNSTQVWVDRGRGLERERVALGAEPQVRALAVHMAAACGRRLDEASPIVDGTLSDGVRLHAVLPPLSEGGTLISLRTSRPSALTLGRMVELGTVPAALEAPLRALVATRSNTLVSGATGAGKTTLLSAMLGLVPPDERIVCIEEVTELRPDHPHVVHLQERRPNVQGAGAVTLADLVRAAMRMRPDRLVLGECRGREVRDVLSALNTGHDGGWATIHANDVEDIPARLSALGALAGMGEAAVSAQAAAAFDAVVQMRRIAGARRVAQIGVLRRRDRELECVVAIDVRPAGVRAGPGWPDLARRLGLDEQTIRGAGAP
ncbi:TadA family conjugal transfer-associated ATPase [Schaalia naturae]|uniref:TadA family conjugal transfer-associated ATPase n=1 Tax=Schaalia naturae TaxID=635203 RepID=A0ABW2SQH2_9ACTO